MTSIINNIAKGQLVQFNFVQDAVAASQTDVQLALNEAQSLVVGASVPFTGAIVAISYDIQVAGTAGVFTIGATIGGTENATTTQTVGTTTQGYAAFGRDAVPLVAGDIVGVEITTDGSWDGTTADLAVVVWVLQYVEGI